MVNAPPRAGSDAGHGRPAAGRVGRVTAPDTRFALPLHRLVAGSPDTGFAWSPYSVASALGLVAAGARGDSLRELAAVLAPAAGPGAEPDLDALAAALAAGAALREDPGALARLAVANTLWADLTLPLSRAYLDAVKSWPGGSARGVDFRGAADAARREINADVERTTHGLIADLLPPDAVDRDTGAVVVNALWLKASWTKEFPAAMTRPRPFRSPGGTVEVPTMTTTRQLAYAARDGWTAVTVPAGEGVVLDVLLPDGDLVGAEPALTPTALDGLLAAQRQTEVELELPRFRVTGQASLREPLAALGVRTVFGPDAELTGVTGGERLAVDDALHKAVLTIDERGLEGAAATAVTMTRLAHMTGRPRPVPVHVDRPFLVLVRHRASGALYFLARITRPR